MMVLANERDFPPGHPAASDYRPDSPEAKEWARRNVHPEGERDFPIDHPAALDTHGNRNALEWKPGCDPLRPDLEPHTGRTPEQAAGARMAYLRAAALVKPTEPPPPIEAPPPPPPESAALPTGQPGTAKGEFFAKLNQLLNDRTAH